MTFHHFHGTKWVPIISESKQYHADSFWQHWETQTVIYFICNNPLNQIKDAECPVHLFALPCCPEKAGRWLDEQPPIWPYMAAYRIWKTYFITFANLLLLNFDFLKKDVWLNCKVQIKCWTNALLSSWIPCISAVETPQEIKDSRWQQKYGLHFILKLVLSALQLKSWDVLNDVLLFSLLHHEYFVSLITS